MCGPVLPLLAWLIMACSGSGLPSLLKTLPLTTDIGNEALSEVDSVWDPFPNDFWDPGLFGIYSQEVTLTSEDNALYITPDATRSGALQPAAAVHTADDVSLYDDGFYFRWKRMEGSAPFAALEITDASFEVDFHIEILDSDMVDIYIWDGTAYAEVFFAYDPNDSRWWRIRHDLTPNQYVVETAGPSCSGWTERIRANVSPYGADLRAVDLRLVMEIAATPVSGEEPGYWGPFNQLPNPRSLPLSCVIGDYKVPSLVATLPLLVEIGDVTP